MDFGTVLSVVQTLLAALQCTQLQDMCSVLGYKSQLESLEMTVNTVKEVLLDAEAQPQELSNQAQRYIEELKDAVYDADDLLDKFVTLAERKQKQLVEDQKVSKKVRRVFSHFKDFRVAYSMSQGVKEVRKRLDAIASNHNRFGFKLDCNPIRKRREETCSYVFAQDIIGREDDVEEIVGQLLGSDVDQKGVSFLTIVGIGGLGKTALAQLVYNDERVKKHFGLRSWACVSDDDKKSLDVNSILSKILESATCHKHDGSSMDVLQGQLQEHLAGKKYLLVLDDVWSENREEWYKLEKFFMGGLWGSWVVVTTRSEETARIVGVGRTYVLKGLTNEAAWCLFERTAFTPGNQHHLVEIGQEIVKKCANVPLAIRVVGSLLYGQGKEKWQSFQKVGLAEIRKDKNQISPILMVSYHNLESPLKSCFSYCAIFPKDFDMKKEMLIRIWMAQGYIVPLDKGQSMEDAAEEYFSILLRRCFFQDVQEDEYTGEISCKMHDLMHDIAQKVAGKEVCVVNSITSNLDRKTRHIYLAKRGKYIEGEGPFTNKIGIRTCLLCDSSIELPVDAFLANWMCLRTLDLHRSGIKSLPYTIGKLLHLRYLDLSNNVDLEVLPKSITKLHNLQTLNLRQCARLKELANDLNKLAKLAVLDIDGCFSLTHMPPDMVKLNCLYRLPMFVVGKANSSSQQGVVDELENLKALTNLKGQLKIRIKIPKNVAYVKGNNSDDQGGYMRSKQHLKIITFEWRNEERDGKEESEEALLEDLQPHPSVKDLKILGYNGKRMPPNWKKEGNFGTFFPNLVRISFVNFNWLQHLPSMEKLPHLKTLNLCGLRKLEYMEDTIRSNISGSDTGASLFFPSLEKLNLADLPKLKGWWRDHDGSSSSSSNSSSRQPRQFPSFPCLSKLYIRECPELTRIPRCPTMEVLVLKSFNERLQIIEKKTSSPPSDSENLKLRKVFTNNVRGLKSVLPMEAFQCLTEMTISHDSEMESMEEVVEVLKICSSSLCYLEIAACNSLRSLSLSGDDNGNMPWRCLHLSLRSLELRGLPKVVKLPKGMQYLTSLQSLLIYYCEALESVPEWMPRLTSLTQLQFSRCPQGLKQRCQSPDGEDWPHIQHIPHLAID